MGNGGDWTGPGAWDRLDSEPAPFGALDPAPLGTVEPFGSARSTRSLVRGLAAMVAVVTVVCGLAVVAAWRLVQPATITAGRSAVTRTDGEGAPGSTVPDGPPPSRRSRDGLPMLDPGIYQVDRDVAPGWYRVDRECTDGPGGQNGLELQRLTAQQAAPWELCGHAVAVVDLPAVNPVRRGFTEGTYLVGADLPPGTYKVTAIDAHGVWANRLREDLDQISSELRPGGSIVVTIEAGDFAFGYRGRLERLSPQHL